MLLARPLGPCVVADVLWNGLWQRARIAEPSTIMGLASILVILAGFVWSGIYDRSSHWKVLPVVGLTFLASWVFALFHFICGCWTQLRYGGKPSRSGFAAMRTALIAGIPIVIATLLMMFGLVDLRLPGTPVPPPSPLAMLFVPLTRLPDAWIWGALGGLLGKRIICERQKAAATRP